MPTFSEGFSPASLSCEPELKTVLDKAEEIRCVRFLLSPQPEDGMATRQQQPRTAKEKQIVLPTAHKEEEDKFGSSNTWGRKQLQLLGVDFIRNGKMDLNRVMRVREAEWSSELRERVAEGARQLEAVDAEKLKFGFLGMDDVRRLAPDFQATFSSLLSVMEIQEMKERAREEKRLKQQQSSQVRLPSGTSTTSPNLTKPSSLSTASEKHTESMEDKPSPRSEPRTPDQPTHPSNPNWTGGSMESKDEENTKKLLFLLLLNTLSILESPFRMLDWQQSGYKVEICQTERDNMKFTLGVESITAINDGGLGIRYNAGPGRGIIQWQPNGIRPVLSLEAKRQRSKKKDDIELVYQYAGQIFCEMLGQTCYKEFYQNHQMEYQESFVIHGSHSSITIYYAKLPNTYLSDIHRYGAKYLQRSESKQHVQLRRTKKFHMRNTEERVELFKLLSKLLWYFISGRSHVGYLYNYDQNPLHHAGQIMYDSIMVEDPPTEDDENVIDGLGDASSSFSEASNREERDDELGAYELEEVREDRMIEDK